MTDWLTPEYRQTMREDYADGGGCTDKEAAQLLAHAAEADRRLAERDDVIRELAEALRAAWSYVPDTRAANGQWLCPAHPVIGAALARVDALGGEQRDAVCSCGKQDRPRGPWHSPSRCAMYAGALDLPIEHEEASDANWQ